MEKILNKSKFDLLKTAVLAEFEGRANWKWLPTSGLLIGIPQEDGDIKWIAREPIHDLKNRIRPPASTFSETDPDPNAHRAFHMQGYGWLLAQLLHYGLGFAMTTKDAAAMLEGAVLDGTLQQPPRLVQFAELLRREYMTQQRHASPDFHPVSTLPEEPASVDGENTAVYGDKHLEITSSPSEKARNMDVSTLSEKAKGKQRAASASVLHSIDEDYDGPTLVGTLAIDSTSTWERRETILPGLVERASEQEQDHEDGYISESIFDENIDDHSCDEDSTVYLSALSQSSPKTPARDESLSLGSGTPVRHQAMTYGNGQCNSPLSVLGKQKAKKRPKDSARASASSYLPSDAADPQPNHVKDQPSIPPSIEQEQSERDDSPIEVLAEQTVGGTLQWLPDGTDLAEWVSMPGLSQRSDGVTSTSPIPVQTRPKKGVLQRKPAAANESRPFEPIGDRSIFSVPLSEVDGDQIASDAIPETNNAPNTSNKFTNSHSSRGKKQSAKTKKKAKSSLSQRIVTDGISDQAATATEISQAQIPDDVDLSRGPSHVNSGDLESTNAPMSSAAATTSSQKKKRDKAKPSSPKSRPLTPQSRQTSQKPGQELESPAEYHVDKKIESSTRSLPANEAAMSNSVPEVGHVNVMSSASSACEIQRTERRQPRVSQRTTPANSTEAGTSQQARTSNESEHPNSRSKLASLPSSEELRLSSIGETVSQRKKSRIASNPTDSRPLTILVERPKRQVEASAPVTLPVTPESASQKSRKRKHSTDPDKVNGSSPASKKPRHKGSSPLSATSSQATTSSKGEKRKDPPSEHKSNSATKKARRKVAPATSPLDQPENATSKSTTSKHKVNSAANGHSPATNKSKKKAKENQSKPANNPRELTDLVCDQRQKRASYGIKVKRSTARYEGRLTREVLRCDEHGVPSEKDLFRNDRSIHHTIRDQVGKPLSRKDVIRHETPLGVVLARDPELRERKRFEQGRTRAGFPKERRFSHRYPRQSSPPRPGKQIAEPIRAASRGKKADSGRGGQREL